MEFGLNEKELEEINIKLKGNNGMSKNGDWRQESRKRVNEAVQFGNYRHPKFRGGLSDEAIKALERAKEVFGLQEGIKELVDRTNKDISGDGK